MNGQVRVKIQTVLFENDRAAIGRFFEAVVESARHVDATVTLHVGDCSAQPSIDAESLQRQCQEVARGTPLATRYDFFGQNLGFGAAHNRLWRQDSSAERLLVINPDAIPAFHLLSRLNAAATTRAAAGAVEARQVPIEHPKRFDPETWETEWVSGACVLFDGAAFTAAGGFDETFFLYAEDVDLSWRLRAAGLRLYCCPETFVMHAKRLVDGFPATTAAERHHGPLGLMLLRAKYGREDLNDRMVTLLRRDPTPENSRMLSEYRRLCQRIAPVPADLAALARFGPDGSLADLRWTYPLPSRLAPVS